MSTENKLYEFKEGDRVSFGGVEGVADLRSPAHKNYPVCCNGWYFTLDGRIDVNHTEPLLKLIGPAPKPKVLKRYYQWKLRYDHGKWVRSSVYMDDNLIDSGGGGPYHGMGIDQKIRIDDDFIEIEVEG